jgi:hypothetical protein
MLYLLTKYIALAFSSDFVAHKRMHANRIKKTSLECVRLGIEPCGGL